MYIDKTYALYALLIGAVFPSAADAQEDNFHKNIFQRAGSQVVYKAEGQSTFTSTQSPLWLNANRQGVSSVRDNNGYLRFGIFHDAPTSSKEKWNMGYGADFVIAYNFENTFSIQQLFVDIDYKKLRLSLGSKERPMQMKNQFLSSGGQTFGINAKPVPGIRIELPNYVSITGKSNWAGFKGHFGYGIMTDGHWQEEYVNSGQHYAKNALLHTKAGYIRLGNEEKFPLVFEGGLEMACQFGGTVYNPRGLKDTDEIKMGHSFKDFFHAIYGGGSDASDEMYKNAKGNTVGSWLFSLSYKFKNWKLRAYYDHYFEDHSMMFGEYGWLDGMVGTEITLPKNHFVSSFVYEFLSTKYQSGSVYHDHTEVIPDQISGVDNYYNHNLYQGWQHWGQAMGNPLFHSPLYNNDGALEFTGTRFIAHHIGLSGNPTSRINYRLLYSYMENWGTYAAPYADKRYCTSFLTEINYQFRNYKKLKLKGWSISAAFAFDRGNEIGDNTGGQITIRKSGLLTQ